MPITLNGTTGLAGNVTGNVAGNVAGNVTGNVTGNLTGTASALQSGVKFPNFSAGVTRTYNTVFQAATDGFLNVDCAGSFRNGIQVLVGATSTPSTRIWAAGDDMNNNTKIISSGLLPIPAGTYYTVGPYVNDAFETVVVTWYPVN